HSIPHSTGRDKEKALQQKSLQSLIFTQSGRRDLNPRPPEPHSGALPDCATSRCHNPGNPHPVNSQQVQDAQTHSGVQRRVSRTNSFPSPQPARNVPPSPPVLNAVIASPLSGTARLSVAK